MNVLIIIKTNNFDFLETNFDYKKFKSSSVIDLNTINKADVKINTFEKKQSVIKSFNDRFEMLRKKN